MSNPRASGCGNSHVPIAAVSEFVRPIYIMSTWDAMKRLKAS